MWQKLKDQIPAILLTALILIGAGFFFYQKAVKDWNAERQEEIAKLRGISLEEVGRATTENFRRLFLN